MTDKRISIRLAMDGKSEFKRDVSELETQAKSSFGNVKASIDGATASTEDMIDALKRASAEESAMLGNASKNATSKGQSSSRTVLGLDDLSAQKAKASAAAINAELKTMDKQAMAVRYALDPLALATDRFAASEATLDKLLKNSKITLDQHAAALKIEKTTLDQMTEAHNKGAKAVGLSSSAIRMMAVSTLPDLAQGLLAGQFSFASFVNQAGQAVQIAGMQPGGFGAALRSTTALFNPYVIGIAAATGATIVAAAATYEYSKANDTLALSLKGIGGASGATVPQLQLLAEQHAKTADIAVSAARDQENAYLHAGITNTDVIGKLIDVSRDYALVTSQDLKAATGSLAKGMTDTTGAGIELLRSLGQLDEKTRAYIVSLEARGQHEEAQATILGKVALAVDGASDHVNTLAEAWHNVETAAGNAFNAIGKGLDRQIGQGPEDLIARYQQQNSGSGARFLSYQQAALTGNLFNRTVTKDQYVNAILGQINGWNDAAAAKIKDQSDRTSLAAGTALKALDPFTGRRKEIDDQVAAVQAQFDLVKAGVGAGSKTQAELTKAQGDLDRANAGRKRQLESLDKSENPKAPGANRAATLAREADSVKVNTTETLKLADAYLTSDAAALKAEATRKAMTEATRKGTDVAAAVQRQMDLTNAQTVLNGAKAAAATRDQADAQKSVNDQVAAGTIPARDAQQALRDEAMLRPLIALRTHMQGDALKELNAVIEATTKGLHDLNTEQQVTNMQAASAANDEQLAYLQRQLGLITATNDQRAIALAQYQTGQAIARNSSVDPDSPDDAFAAAVNQGISSDKTARAGITLDEAKYSDDVTRSLREQSQLDKLELSLLGQKDAAIEKVLALERARQDMKLRGIDAESEEGRKILDAVAAQQNMNAELSRGKALQSEYSNTQDQIGDRLQSYFEAGKYGLKSFGDLGKSVISDLLAEVVKLSLVNPFKNWAFNQNNPTLDISSVINAIGGLPGHAAGTESAAAGYAWVGENGPELMKLRAGDVIKSNPVSNAMNRSPLASQPRQQQTITIVHNVDLRGAMVDKDVMSEFKKMATQVSTDVTRAGLNQYDKALPGRVAAIKRDPRKR